jgi:hypothetical protein
MKELLVINEVSADVITSGVAQATAEMERIMWNFKSGQTQVLCVTTGTLK